MNLIYFSSVSENTHRFVRKLDAPASVDRIPLKRADAPLKATEPFILVTPTYGGGSQVGGDVPKQVIRFLNDPDNRSLLRGVVSSGNTNFGADFCRAGDIIATKCGVPVLHRFELLGTSEDVRIVNEILEKELPQ
ncbi:NrdI-like flavodoxin [Microbacterium phage Pumpernickel]|uniref:NrdI-like flavodoxin n=1 Tax=Microbacterium phage Pumpernickel TaxID=2885983 RepID=A0AAE8Y791_9CAUD|nr:NrdI-like flavodoxin [Microbacterium phage Pumpernickel]UDL15950.1 NrdI-like flavodoxin [Microbacterium phage Pumpernickel]